MVNPQWMKQVDYKIKNLEEKQAELNAKLVAVRALLLEIKTLKETSQDKLDSIMKANEKLSDESGERLGAISEIKGILKHMGETIQAHIDGDDDVKVPED